MVGCLMGLNSEIYNIRFELNSGLSCAYEDDANKDKDVEERVSIALMIHFSGCYID